MELGAGVASRSDGAMSTVTDTTITTTGGAATAADDADRFVALAREVGVRAAATAARHDRDGTFVTEAYDAMRELGYLRLAVPRMPSVSHVSTISTPSTCIGKVKWITSAPGTGSPTTALVVMTSPTGAWLVNVLRPLTR